MATIEDYEDEIEAAEQAVEEEDDRLPIIDTMEFECIHGYIKPGEEPVAYVPPLQRKLGKLVAEDGSISGMFPIEGEAASYGVRTEYPEDDKYIAVLDDLLKVYTIPGDRDIPTTA